MRRNKPPQRTSVDRRPSEHADVCVVGAGVAGGLVADSLSSRGHDVIVLEAGPRFSFDSRLERMERAIRPEHTFQDVWDMGGPRDRFTSSGDIQYELNRARVKGVGGTTLHWLGTTPRLHEKDFEMETRYGLATDWPIGYADLQPYYAAAEEELGVAGDEDNPFAPPRDQPYPLEVFPPSHVDVLYREACQNLDITVHSVPQARNSKSFDGRSQCLGYSTCTPVCPSGAKYSGDVHIQKAEENGARILDEVPVQSLKHDSEGRTVKAAEYLTPSGDRYRQEADVFVIACGAVETARLLLLSSSSQHPDGLANSSGLVGRYFMEHPIVQTRGSVEKTTQPEPVGFFTSASEQFYDHENQSPGSIFLQFENSPPSGGANRFLHGGDATEKADLLDPVFGDRWGQELYDELIDESGENHQVGILAAVEQLPRYDNAITLDSSQLDAYGNPVPDVSLNIGGHERESMRRALDIQSEILMEMGANLDSQLDPNRPVFGAHHMGTTRMGTKPAKSVVDPYGRTHDLDNLFVASSSVFVTAGAVNPTLTIAALSLRTAEHIDAQL